MGITEKMNLVLSYIDAYNRFDIDGMLTLVHPEVVFKNITGGEVNTEVSGIDALRDLANQARELFSSRHQEIIDIRFADNCAEADIAFEGVLAIDLAGGMEAGDIIALEGRSEFEFKGNKIWRITDIT